MSISEKDEDKDRENNDVIDMEEDSDDDDPIDDEQLEEYEEMVEQLGTFPVSCRCIRISYARPFDSLFSSPHTWNVSDA